MKEINYKNCMKRKCNSCKNYDYCFGYRPGKGETQCKKTITNLKEYKKTT